MKRNDHKPCDQSERKKQQPHPSSSQRAGIEVSSTSTTFAKSNSGFKTSTPKAEKNSGNQSISPNDVLKPKKTSKFATSEFSIFFFQPINITIVFILTWILFIACCTGSTKDIRNDIPSGNGVKKPSVKSIVPPRTVRRTVRNTTDNTTAHPARELTKVIIPISFTFLSERQNHSFHNMNIIQVLRTTLAKTLGLTLAQTTCPSSLLVPRKPRKTRPSS